jgi:mannan endo-1,6-alpha-mannosidase
LNVDSIKSAAKGIVKVIVDTYNVDQPGKPIGYFDSPYYWWSAGAVWDSMIDYWYLTGDSTYNNIVHQALLSQVGPNNDFMPTNQTKAEVFVMESTTLSECLH